MPVDFVLASFDSQRNCQSAQPASQPQPANQSFEQSGQPIRRSEEREKVMEKVEKYFENRVSKTGIVPTGAQLLAFARAAKLSPSVAGPRQIYTFLREQSAVTAPFSKPKKIKAFQTIGVPRPGMYFIDYGEFKKNWSWHNNGCTGFLVAVENLTNRLFVLPTKGKDTRQWLSSIDQFVELTRDVRVLLSDRDSVATSVDFRRKIEAKYGIRWHFLRKGNKSYLAERYVGFVKTKLSQALSLTPGKKRWVDLVLPLCQTYNAEKIAGTSYTRKSVQASTFNHFLSQLLKLRGGEAELENRFSGFKASPFLNERWNTRVFKFKLGDKVRLSRAANWKAESGEKKAGIFERASSKGHFSRAVYTVSGRQLRTNKKRDSMVAVYSLAEFDNLFHFYESDLLKAA